MREKNDCDGHKIEKGARQGVQGGIHGRGDSCVTDSWPGSGDVTTFTQSS